MTDEDEAMWRKFEEIGEEKVRLDLGASRYGEARKKLANQWLEYRESTDSSEQRRKTLAAANDANDLARAANESASEANVIARRAADSARETAAAARNSNIIATAALIAALIAIALSIIGIFLGK